jgi:hypothetical protein
MMAAHETNLGPNLAALLERYQERLREGAGHHELARLEDEIMRHPERPRFRGPNEHRRWLRSVGIPINQYRMRREVFCARSALLWEHIEHGMALSRAHTLLREARRRSPGHVDAGLADVIIEAQRRGTLERLRAKQAPSRARAEGKGDAKGWSMVRQALIELARSRAASLSVDDREAEIDRLVADVEAAFEAFRHRLGRKKRHEIPMPSVEDLRSACALLGLDLPEPGQDLASWVKDAKKRGRCLAREYHPDVNKSGGSLEEYRAVVEAMTLCERYAEAASRFN